MISTLSIFSIFLQIFTAGIAMAGAYSFFIRYFERRKIVDFHLSLIFAAFSLYTALTVVSQIVYTLGVSTTVRFFIHRVISIDLIIGSLFIAYFIREKFVHKTKIILRLFLVACIVEIVLLSQSPLNLIENIYGISSDPGVHFLFAIPPEIFWVFLWFLLGFKYIISARAAKEHGEKNVDNLAGISSFLVILAFFSSFYYAKSGEAYYLVGSWAIYLCSAVGFFLGNIISPKDEIAEFPLSYFRTRILYKLILIFILLITILLEATTIATINLNQISLQKAIKNNYSALARNISDKINYSEFANRSQEKSYIQNLIGEETQGKRIVYVVASNGSLYASPDPKEEGRDMSSNSAVKKVLSGLYGNDEFLSDFFARVEDKDVVAAFAPVKKYNLGVIIEEPKWEAYSEIRLVSTNTLIFVLVGIFLTVSVGIFFAKSIEASIKEVISGTEAVSKGDLSYRIKIGSIDEIGQLANAFNQMTRELKLSQENLVSSEKLASLGTMAAGMAHEIKNPLVSLRTFTQLLPQRFADEEFRQKFATVVPQEIDKINRIAESLLRFGRPHKPELTQININEILEEILALFDSEARKNNVRITIKLAELPKITADSAQLSQAFVNIILNAIQAMPKGGDLTVKTDVGEVIKLTQGEEEGVEAEGKAAKPIPVVFIEISDTGVGIPEDNLKKVFDPFFTTKEVGGTGMGLPITLRIIEDHHGSVKVKSQVGKGTTFLVTLPQSLEERV